MDLALLPSEILHIIFAYILDHTYGTTTDTHRACAGLARSCRSLNCLSTHYLYTRYEAPIERPIAGFLRAVFHSDEIFRDLKHIDILSIAKSSQQGRLRRRDLLVAASRLPEPYCSIWTNDIRTSLAARNEIGLAMLILRASNLESITMTNGAERAERQFDDLTAPPIWLRPLTESGLAYTGSTWGNALNLPYQNLHTLTLNLQYSNPTRLAHLFALPSLRNLHLINLLDHAFLRWIRNGGGWEDLKTYPAPSPCPWFSGNPSVKSTVASLTLENTHIPTSHIISMIRRCASLRAFDITGVECPECIFNESRRWCIDILQALGAHKETLEDLRLDAHVVWPLNADGFDEWASVAGFNGFLKLKRLDTTFSNLFGHPRGRMRNGVFVFDEVGNEHWWNGAEQWLPGSCEELRVRFDGVLEINCDQIFLDLMDKGSLEEIHVYYHYGNMFLDSVMTHPVNFWDVQRAFRENGSVKFGYMKVFEMWGSAMGCEKFESVARQLADYGVKGVAMATHYDAYGDDNGPLEDKVMEYLGLEKSWLSSEEGMMIML